MYIIFILCRLYVYISYLYTVYICICTDKYRARTYAGLCPAVSTLTVQVELSAGETLGTGQLDLRVEDDEAMSLGSFSGPQTNLDALS